MIRRSLLALALLVAACGGSASEEGTSAQSSSAIDDSFTDAGLDIPTKPRDPCARMLCPAGMFCEAPADRPICVRRAYPPAAPAPSPPVY